MIRIVFVAKLIKIMNDLDSDLENTVAVIRYIKTRTRTGLLDVGELTIDHVTTMGWRWLFGSPFSRIKKTGS